MNAPQAGVTEGKLLSNMGAALSGGGLRSVYAGYLSFMISNIPYDVAELCTYRCVRQSPRPGPRAQCPGL